ncbi:MAG TPA: [protein-PII] uridylyltransferase, partial [Verrucomicrobiales bacterium]|nr:[protein-PII] uridylyltransferase [Verrucomicrobiales bacterium]
GGLEICEARACVIDQLLRSLWTATRGSLSPQAQKEFPPLSLVAIGGYGRSELNPSSDIDIMVLHSGQVVAGSKPLPHLSRFLDGVLLPLFDLGLKVGHSVRDVNDCVEVANANMQSKTSLIEARLVIGDEELFRRFQRTLLAKCVAGHEAEYIAARVEDQSSRRARFGNSATMQEPNIKNGCGGLRDFQNLRWMAFFKYGTRSLVELEQREMISSMERRQLEAGYDFLLRVRTDLHYHLGRAVDVLSRAVQPAIATHLGYSDRSPSRRIEKFMGDYYTHSRNLYLITRNVEERLALLPQPRRRISLRSLLPLRRKVEETLVDGFKVADDTLRAATNRVFHDQPRRLMRVFLHAQQRGLKLHPDLSQLVRNNLRLVDRAFLRDPHVKESFLEILNQRGSVAPILRSMHETGLLGKYLPEFGRLTNLVQHEFFHQYTTDEHTLVCLEKLDALWKPDQPQDAPYSELFHRLERPFLLYLALLLHDAGKAGEHDEHSEAGGRLADRVGRRLELDGAMTHALRLVIEQHLTMAVVSQRRDMEDPAVVRQFVHQVQSMENLWMLTLHTYVDSQATSDRLWNGFKDSLLWTLHNKARTLLEGKTEFLVAEARERELLQEEVGGMLPRTIGVEEVGAHFGSLPARYFRIHQARQIAVDIALAHQFIHKQFREEEVALEPVLDWHNEPDRGLTRVRLCTWDRPGLFGRIAGSFAAAGINILSAQVFSRDDGMALDSFEVTSGRTGSAVTKEERQRFEELLFRALSGEKVDFRGIMLKPAGGRKVDRAWLEGGSLPIAIRFDNETSEDSTVIDVETEDRLGLLHAIAEVFVVLHLDIQLAKIVTEHGAALDAFYVVDADGQKIRSIHRQQFVESRLREAIGRLAD